MLDWCRICFDRGFVSYPKLVKVDKGIGLAYYRCSKCANTTTKDA
jgi:hypothetical protein